jgi:hypothetical protein
MDPEIQECVLTEQEARAKLDRASGNLAHRWFWPEVRVPDWIAALQAFERVAREILCSGVTAERLEGDQGVLGIAGYTSGMGPLLGHWLETGQLAASSNVASVFALHLDHNRRRMETMRKHACTLVEALSLKSVRATVLKGMHTANVYFPEPGARPLSDIDILIDREQRAAAAEAMLELGFVAGLESYRPDGQQWHPPKGRSEPMTLRYVHKDDPWSVDMQFSLNRQCVPGAPLLALDDCGLMDDAEPWVISNAAAQLRPTQLFFHLLVHSSYGLDSLSLLRICELTLVARRHLEDGVLDWDFVEHFARRAGALGAIYPALRMTDTLVPGIIDKSVLKASADAAPRSVVRRIATLSPATAQRVRRTSLFERFMWTSSPRQIVRHVWEYVAVPHFSTERRRVLYTHRFARLMRLARIRQTK